MITKKCARLNFPIPVIVIFSTYFADLGNMQNVFCSNSCWRDNCQQIKLNSEVTFVPMGHCTVTTNTTDMHSHTDANCKLPEIANNNMHMNKAYWKWITPQRRMWVTCIIIWILKNKLQADHRLKFVKNHFRDHMYWH